MNTLWTSGPVIEYSLDRGIPRLSDFSDIDYLSGGTLNDWHEDVLVDRVSLEHPLHAHFIFPQLYRYILYFCYGHSRVPCNNLSMHVTAPPLPVHTCAAGITGAKSTTSTEYISSLNK